MSEVCYTEGSCNRPLRLKHWKKGFSIKCMVGARTLVGLTSDVESYIHGFETFCSLCSEKDNRYVKIADIKPLYVVPELASFIQEEKGKT